MGDLIVVEATGYKSKSEYRKQFEPAKEESNAHEAFEKKLNGFRESDGQLWRDKSELDHVVVEVSNGKWIVLENIETKAEKSNGASEQVKASTQDLIDAIYNKKPNGLELRVYRMKNKQLVKNLTDLLQINNDIEAKVLIGKNNEFGLKSKDIAKQIIKSKKK